MWVLVQESGLLSLGSLISLVMCPTLPGGCLPPSESSAIPSPLPLRGGGWGPWRLRPAPAPSQIPRGGFQNSPSKFNDSEDGVSVWGLLSPSGAQLWAIRHPLSRAGLCVLEFGTWRKRCGQGGDNAATERNVGPFTTQDRGPTQVRISAKV